MKTLARMGYSFDCWLYCPQMDDLTALADAVPECKIVLNHCGGIVGINALQEERGLPGLEEVASKRWRSGRTFT